MKISAITARALCVCVCHFLPTLQTVHREVLACCAVSDAHAPMVPLVTRSPDNAPVLLDGLAALVTEVRCQIATLFVGGFSLHSTIPGSAD